MNIYCPLGLGIAYGIMDGMKMIKKVPIKLTAAHKAQILAKMLMKIFSFLLFIGFDLFWMYSLHQRLKKINGMIEQKLISCAPV